MFKFVILGIIFIVVFLAGYLTIWKHIIKPMNKEGDLPKSTPETKQEGKSNG